MPSRANQYRNNLTVDGINLGQWDDRTGGDSDSNSSQYFLGSMGARISLGGTIQVNNVIFTTLRRDDLDARAKWLLGRAGKGAAKGSQQPLDDEGNAIGDPFIWTGRVKRVKIPEPQSQGNGPALYEIELEVDGQVA